MGKTIPQKGWLLRDIGINIDKHPLRGIVSSIESFQNENQSDHPLAGHPTFLSGRGGEKERAVLKDQESIHHKIISAAVFRRELTKREIDVLTLVAQGYKNREIAKKLGVAVKTVENHRVNILNKLGLRNTVQMIRYAIEKDIVPIESK